MIHFFIQSPVQWFPMGGGGAPEGRERIHGTGNKITNILLFNCEYEADVCRLHSTQQPCIFHEPCVCVLL